MWNACFYMLAVKLEYRLRRRGSSLPVGLRSVGRCQARRQHGVQLLALGRMLQNRSLHEGVVLVHVASDST